MQVYRLAFELCKSYDLPMTQAAVLTGDLIGSTEAGPEAVDRAMRKLEIDANIFIKHQQIEPMRFTRSRGDGWQMIIRPAHKYLRATAFFLAALRHADIGIQTRIGIGIGQVIFDGTDDLSDAHGPAFVKSGHALDQVGPQDRLAILGLSEHETNWCSAALETLSYLSSRWSVEQAGAIAGR
jgi:hypothetical protein